MRCSTCQQRPLMMSVHLAEHRSPWPANLNWVVQRRERRAVESDNPKVLILSCWMLCRWHARLFLSGLTLTFLCCSSSIHSFVQLKQSAFCGRSHSLMSASSAVLKWYFCSIKHPWPSVQHDLPCLPCSVWQHYVLFPFKNSSISSAALLSLFWGVGGDNLCWFLFLLPD